MIKEALKIKLQENHKTFLDFISNLSDDLFIKSKVEKWTAGQQLEHIYLSVKPVRQALSLPKFLLLVLLGKANRKSRNYEDLVIKYLGKLSNGGKAPIRFIPAQVTLEMKPKLIELLTYEIVRLNRKIDKFSETELDKFVLPHPLLGKLTIREMLYFTIYHVEHHQKSITEICEP
jgi:hypothetical protein